MELWTLTHSSPDGMQKRAERAERAGWVGLCVVDSQCLAGRLVRGAHPGGDGQLSA